MIPVGQRIPEDWRNISSGEIEHMSRMEIAVWLAWLEWWEKRGIAPDDKLASACLVRAIKKIGSLELEAARTMLAQERQRGRFLG